jgi:SusD/RagB-like outer membrane lipoprotein
MKILLKIAAIFLLFFMSACDTTELDLQDNPNAVTAENADIELFYNAVELRFAQFFNSATGLTMPIVRMMPMTGGNQYNNQYSPESFNTIWNVAYEGLLPDMDELIAKATESELYIHAGAAKTMKAYMLMTLVDLFGDVPYSESNKGIEFQNPNRDGGEQVYSAAVALLNEAVADFGKTGRGAPDNDIFYKGSAEQWTKIANTFLLKYYVTTRLVNNGAAEINALVASGNIITSNSDDFQFQYGTNRVNPDSRHPFYNAMYETDNGPYLSNYYMWSLLEEKGLVDPRLRFYFYRQDCDTTDEDQFTLDCPTIPRPAHYTGPYPWCVASEEGWWGREHGNNDGIPPDGQKRTAYGLYPGGGKFDADDCVHVKNSGTDGMGGNGINPIMLASFVDFMRAEAALTMGTTDDPRAMFESGMRNSLDKVLNFAPLQVPAGWMPTQNDIDTYVNIVLSIYDNAGSEDAKLDIIAKEYHIALWGNGVEAFNMYRRTGFPSGMQPTREPDAGTFPRLFFYPADHVNLNLNAQQRTLGEKGFWDTNANFPE